MCITITGCNKNMTVFFSRVFIGYLGFSYDQQSGFQKQQMHHEPTQPIDAKDDQAQ
jgi:hypothetical protein